MSVSLPATLGPRKRRRLAIAAGLAAVIVAVVVAVVLTRATPHPGRASPALREEVVTHPDRIVTINFFGGIRFGMTPQQVQHLLGKPTTKQGRCWRYQRKVDRYLAAFGVVKSFKAVCFFGGRLSDTTERNYVRRHGKLVLWHAPRPELP